MKAQRLGMLSALVASVCCVGPALLVLLGLGSLGIGALIGRYHWWFIAIAMGLLTISWRSYLGEARRCRTAQCEMKQGKSTRISLIIASCIVATFILLNLYAYASQSRNPNVSAIVPGEGLSSAVITVEGMTCFTCELAIESSAKRLSGVESIDAKVSEKAAYVQYDPAKTSLNAIIQAINKTGYKATLTARKRGQK